MLILPEIDQIKIATTYTPDRKRAELSVQETCKSFSETPGGLAQPGMCVGVGSGRGGLCRLAEQRLGFEVFCTNLHTPALTTRLNSMESSIDRESTETTTKAGLRTAGKTPQVATHVATTQ